MSYRDIIVYISAPIRAATKPEEDENCKRAVRVANTLVESGFSVICPHASYPAVREVGGQHGPWLESDCAVVRACDAIFVVGDKLSDGMQLEVDAAYIADVPAFDSVQGLKAYADGLYGGACGSCE